jgi:hypothetical protein
LIDEIKDEMKEEAKHEHQKPQDMKSEQDVSMLETSINTSIRNEAA